MVAFIVLYVVESSLGVVLPNKRYKLHSKIRKSKIDADFKETYNYIESKYANELENERKKVIKSIIVCLLLFAISFLVFIILFGNDEFATYRRGLRSTKLKLYLLFVPLYIYYILRYKKVNKIYVKNFKEKIMNKMVEYFNENLTYYQSGANELIDLYREANFEDKKFNCYRTYDYIEGFGVKGTNIEIFNIALENYNQKRVFLNSVFEGIFISTKLNTFVSEEIRITKRKYKRESKMKDEEFYRYFNIDSNILEQRILTKEIREQIVKFYKQYNIIFEIVIKNNNVSMRFETGNFIEPNILNKSRNINNLWIYFNILRFAIEFTSKINYQKTDNDIE